MDNKNRQILKKVNGTRNDAANAGTSRGNNNQTIKQKPKRKVHWPEDLLNLVQYRLFDANNDESSNEEEEDEVGQAGSSTRYKRLQFGGEEMGRIDKQREREKRNAFLQMDNNDEMEEAEENERPVDEDIEDVWPKQEKEEEDVIYLSDSDTDNDDELQVVLQKKKNQETKIEWPGKLHEVYIDPLEWNSKPAGKNSQAKLIEEARWAETTKNSDPDAELIETGQEYSTLNPKHKIKRIPLELVYQIVRGEENGNVNGGNNMEDNGGGGEVEENVVNEVGVEDDEETSPQNIVETTTSQVAQIELDRNPCCSNSLPKMPSSSSEAKEQKQQNNDDPFQKFNELKRQLCEMFGMSFEGKNTFSKEKIKQILTKFLDNNEVNENEEKKNDKQQNDEVRRQIQANEENVINGNSNEIDEALKNCFGQFDDDDDDEEDEADGKDNHNSNYRIGNLRFEPQKITLPKIKIDPDEENEENSLTEIQPIINEYSNQRQHIEGNNSLCQFDKNVEEIGQENQREIQKKKKTSEEKLEKRKRKRQEKSPQRVHQQEQQQSRQTSRVIYSSTSPPPATLSRHAHLQRFQAPPTPDLTNADSSQNINYGKDAQPRCKFYSAANKICRDGEKCLFYHDRSHPTRSTEIQRIGRKNGGTGGTNFNCVFHFGRGFCEKGSKCNFLHGDMPTLGSNKYLKNNRRKIFNELLPTSTSTIRPISPIRPNQPSPPTSGGLKPPPPPPTETTSSLQLFEEQIRKFLTSFNPDPELPPPPPIILQQEEEEKSPTPPPPPPPLPHPRIALSQQLLDTEISPSPQKREHRRNRSSSRSHSRRSRSPSRRSHHRRSSLRRHRSRSRSESISPKRTRQSRSRSRISIQRQPENARRSRSRSSSIRRHRARRSHSESISPTRTRRSRSRSRISIRRQPERRSRSRSRTRTRIIIEYSDDDNEERNNKSRNSDEHRPMPYSNPHTHHTMGLPVGHRSFTKPELRSFVKDCPHFVQKGWCWFGQNCCFSHGDDQPTRGYQDGERRNREYRSPSRFSPLTIPPTKDDETRRIVVHQSFTKPELRQFVKDCPQFLKGSCGFGLSCRYSHGDDAQHTRGYQLAEQKLKRYRQQISRNDDDENAANPPTSSRGARSRSRSRH